MKISTEQVHDVVIVGINGELDSHGNQLLDKTLKDLCASGSYKVIIDLATIRFVGSQTVSILVSNLKEIRAGNGNIKFLNPQRAVMQYLKSNRIIELFECYSTKNEAVLSFDSSLKAPSAAVSARPAKQPTTTASSSGMTSPRTGSQPAAQPPAPEAVKKPVSAASNVTELGENLQAGEILYANSCILATLVKTLEKKGVLTTDEAVELLNYDH